jgi:hypothetical protein
MRAERRGLSLPNVDANACNATSATLIPLLKAMGTWHGMTSVEWALMQAMAVKSRYSPWVPMCTASPRWMRPRPDAVSTAKRRAICPHSLRAFIPAPVRSLIARTKYNGISDLAGNVWERTYGARGGR